MNNKLLDIINPKIDPWLQALESQAKNITLSDGTVLGVVSSKKEQPMTNYGTCENEINELLDKIKAPNRRRRLLGKWVRAEDTPPHHVVTTTPPMPPLYELKDFGLIT